MGCFDTLHFNCPNCGAAICYQSKLGEKNMSDYSLDNAPLIVIADLHDEALKDRLYCDYCHNRIHVKVRFSTRLTCDANQGPEFREV